MNLYVVGALAAILVMSHWFMFEQGKDTARNAVVKAEIEAYVAQDKIKNRINNISAEQLCIGIGGLPDDCRKLRVD